MTLIGLGVGGGLAASGAPKAPAAPKPPKTLPPAKVENEAQKEAEKRRRMYLNVGRSSTILTDPNKLGNLSDQSQAPKTLLGL